MQESIWKSFWNMLCFKKSNTVLPKGINPIASAKVDAQPVILKTAPIGSERVVLPPLCPIDIGKKCLVLDLDETLVHSTFETCSADLVMPITMGNYNCTVYVNIRPHAIDFLRELGSIYEIVIFTASLATYADKVIDAIDTHNVVKHRLFRESCVEMNGAYIKDLSVLGRSLDHTIIIDNMPHSYAMHPQNGIPITSWFSDRQDEELKNLIPHLQDISGREEVLTHITRFQ